MSGPLPVVSVIIPTLRRSKLLLSALESVFAQTFRAFEVIVVVDGPDPEAAEALRGIDDTRLRFYENEKSLTAAGARSFAVSRAKGEWIAFLDDDDEWLPQKLERQLSVARSSSVVLVTALSRVVTPLATYVWPREIFDNARPVGDYLFDRKAVFAGASFIQTSSYLLPRALYQKVPFRVGTPHDDWDFLLRLAQEPGVQIVTVPEVLVQVHFEQSRPSLSRTDAWAVSLDWADRVRPLLSRRAYSGFCLAVIGPRAADDRAYSAILPLLFRAFARGQPRLRHLLAFMGFWTIPQGIRRRLRAAFAWRRAVAVPRARPASDPASGPVCPKP
jgi:glycosyltransferase involved in cell wall biosynthesis